MSDAKKIEIKKVNEHHDLKDVEEFKKMIVVIYG